MLADGVAEAGVEAGRAPPTHCPRAPEPPHLRICVWKAKVCVLGRGWAGVAGPLSSSEAVEGKLVTGACSPSYPTLSPITPSQAP